MKSCLALLFAAVKGGVPGLDGRGRYLSVRFDYKTNNGEDWPTLTMTNNECGKENT
jgi:hypothetical protein